MKTLVEDTTQTSPSVDLHVEAKSDHLKGRLVTLCAGGGIACVDVPRFARELRRHGAQVRIFATENALRFVGREALEWATGAPVTVTPTGFAEHIAMGDAVVVFPATADILSKAALGLCTDGVTTLLQSALGREIPVIFCPTMHESLAASPVIRENRARLARFRGVSFVSPLRDEGKEKSRGAESLATEVCHHVNRKRRDDAGTRARTLVTLGGTRSLIDPVRCVSNLSSGELGMEVARALYERGCELTAVVAQTRVPLPALEHARVFVAPDYEDFARTLKAHTAPLEGIFHIAAVSDYVMTPAGEKLDSKSDTLNLTLRRASKCIDFDNLKNARVKVACKLTTGDETASRAKALAFLKEKALGILLWNQANEAFSSENPHKAVVLSSKGTMLREEPVSGKRVIAHTLVRLFDEHLQDASS